MKKIFIFLFLIFSTFILFSQDLEDEGKKEDPDMEALRRWIREKRMISIKEIGGDLSLSGEVRFEFQAINERRDGSQQRGLSNLTKPVYGYDVEVNIMLDYQSDQTWSSIKIEFDNNAGNISGTTNKIALEKAYLGVRLIDGETFNFDGEIGRRNLSNVFDSKIEFSILFDGGVIKAWESIGSFYTNLGVFIISDLKNHYGEVIEMGMLKIANTGLYMKYSFINWKKDFSQDETFRNKRFDFAISQFQIGYQGIVSKYDKYIKIYLAGLMNHLADKIVLSGQTFKKYNLGAYLGLSYGRILQKGDWAVDANYQYVMPQAIPDFDVSGISNGNTLNSGLYTVNIDGTGGAATINNAVGSANYQGASFEFLYAITNNITLLQNFEFSFNQTKAFGPSMSYQKYEMEFIYAF